MGEGEDALGRQVAAVLVHRGEGGDHLVHESDLGVGRGHPVRCCPMRPCAVPDASYGRRCRAPGTVWTSSHRSGGRLAGSQASSS